jgi:3-isopropylmalate/(R)-2-methylmalate dehydratase large subunit
MTMIEKILAAHSNKDAVKPGEIVDVRIDVRVARDFGGANVVKHLKEHDSAIDDPAKTFFTFDCNPTGSDQKYAENQQTCRLFAREHGIKVYDINRGIGTHILIDEGLVYPGITAVSTDSHANILGAVGAFGQGMGDLDIAAVWGKGKTWFKVPESVKIIINGKFPQKVHSKDVILNILAKFGASQLLGYSVEVTGDAIAELGLDDRITIASMGTELGAITILFEPNIEVLRYCESHICRRIEPVKADQDARYVKVFELQAGDFVNMVSRPGKPHDAVPVKAVAGQPIDSAFIGSCTNGRLQDMRVAAEILQGRKVAPGIILKIVPSTDKIWNLCLEEGLFSIFKEARAMISNAGCAGCAAGQVGQNGPGEVTISSGNRNFTGKQGKGEVWLASPAIIAASAVAGYITTPDKIPAEYIENIAIPDKITGEPTDYINTHDKVSVEPLINSPAEKKIGFPVISIDSGMEEDSTGTELKASEKNKSANETQKSVPDNEKPVVVTGNTWYINMDNIDTDMIYHNRHLAITDIREMGKFAFGNLKGYEDFSSKARPGDIIVSGKNFGSGSSRQQAVDCFIALGIQCIIAESFGAIYERNAINAAFPILVSSEISKLELQSGDKLMVDFTTGKITNLRNNTQIKASAFSEVQMEIYRQGGLF